MFPMITGTRFSSLKNRSGVLLLAGLLLIANLSCDSLFLPQTGVPEEAPSLRATPQGTIEQLIRAYEDKRIDLFIDLLPKNKTFRFYVSPDYSAAYVASKGPDATLERVDSQYCYVKAGSYYYWGYDDEIARHRNLFSLAQEINFTELPIVDPRDFRYTVTAENETTMVEVKMTAGELCIDLPDQIYCTQREGQMQVFLLERETGTVPEEKLWVIRNWFDLNTIQ